MTIPGDTTEKSVIWFPGEEKGKNVLGEEVEAPKVATADTPQTHSDTPEDEVDKEETAALNEQTDEGGSVDSEGAKPFGATEQNAVAPNAEGTPGTGEGDAPTSTQQETEATPKGKKR